MTPEVPHLASRYRFVRSLLTGLKSMYWLALDEQTGSEVVASPLGAARIAGLEGIVGVRHPHLAAIIDVVHDPDPRCIPARGAGIRIAAVAIAEAVFGPTAHELIKEVPLPPYKAVDVVTRVAEALMSVHGLGGVHGAVSPRSIVVAPPAPRLPPVLAQLVSPTNGAYCTPERLRGASPSAADDVWGLWATLYTLLAASPPFPGRSRDELVANITQGAASLRQSVPIDPELAEFVALGLHVDSARRVSDVAALLSLLRDWQRDNSATTVHAPLTSLPVPAGPPALPEDDGEEWDDDAATVVVSAKDFMAMMPGALAEADRNDPSEPPEAATRVYRPPEALLAESGGVRPAAGAPPAASPPARVAALGQTVKMDPRSPASRPMQQTVRMASDAPRSDLPLVAPMSSAPASFPGAPPAMPYSGAPAQSFAPPAKPKSRRGCVIFLLLLLLAAGGAAFFFRGKLMQLIQTQLASAQTASAPLAASQAPSHDPAASATPEPASPPDAGALDASATRPASGDAAPASQSVGECVGRQFSGESFKTDQDFDFLCADQDFRGTNSQLHRRLVVAGRGKVTAGMKEWAVLSWFELAVSAVVRGRCCPSAAPIKLPKTAGSCDQLAEVLESFKKTAPTPADFDARAKSYETAITCLFATGIPRPYHYRERPSGENRVAFESFIKRTSQ